MTPMDIFTATLREFLAVFVASTKTNILTGIWAISTVFVVTREGILTQNMMMTNPNQLIKNWM